ncbi:hypothetical protein Ancab_028839 [Ancistrocladus abbreviatus]
MVDQRGKVQGYMPLAATPLAGYGRFTLISILWVQSTGKVTRDDAIRGERRTPVLRTRRRDKRWPVCHYWQHLHTATLGIEQHLGSGGRKEWWRYAVIAHLVTLEAIAMDMKLMDKIRNDSAKVIVHFGYLPHPLVRPGLPVAGNGDDKAESVAAAGPCRSRLARIEIIIAISHV